LFLETLMTITLDDQIACVRRELALRRSVYRRRVLDKKMTQDIADRELAHMEAVLETLMACLTMKSRFEAAAAEFESAAAAMRKAGP
jgi:phage gp16-like protein